MPELTEIEAHGQTIREALFDQERADDTDGLLPYPPEAKASLDWLLALVGDLERQLAPFEGDVESFIRGFKEMESDLEAAERELALMHLATTEHLSEMRRELADARAAAEKLAGAAVLVQDAFDENVAVTIPISDWRAFWAVPASPEGGHDG